MAFDATKPTASGFLVSSEIRQNWLALQSALGGVNLVADPTFLIWPAETVNTDSATTTQLAHWTLSGASATLRRAGVTLSGTALSDTNRRAGRHSVKMISGAGAEAVLTQSLLTTTSYDDFVEGLTFSAGCWVKCSSGSAARISIDDGFGTPTYSSFHPGDGTWRWLTVSRTIDASATLLAVRMNIVAGTITAYFAGYTALLGETPPAYYVPAPIRYENLHWRLNGNIATGNTKINWRPHRPGLVLDTALAIITAPTTQALICDVNTWDSAAFTTMYSTRPQIAAAATLGGARPDATSYARRCFTGGYDTGNGAGSMLSFDVDQVGSGTVGADLDVSLRYLMYARPLEGFLAYNENAA